MHPPSDKDKHRFKRAMEALDKEKPRDAIRLFEKVRKSWGDNPDIGYLEGLAYGKLGDTKGVIRVSERALKLAPDHFGALGNLANAQMLMGHSEDALENYTKALETNPNAPEVLGNYGRALATLGRHEEAIEYCKRALTCNPTDAPVLAALGKSYALTGHTKAALQEFKKALQLNPKLYEAHIGLGVLNCGSGGLDDAELHFNEALHIEKGSIAAYVGLANVKRYTGDYDKALKFLSGAEKYTSKDDPSLLGLKANLLEQKGDKEQAYNIINQLMEADNMFPQAIDVFSKLCHKYDRCDEALEMIDRSIEQPATNTPEKQALMFAAGNLLDKLNRYDAAMHYYHQANSAVDIQCNRDAYTRQNNEIINCFSKSAMTDMPRASTGSSRPIFVLGMPRSGTTLTEQILASHTDVFGAGELHYIKQLDLSIRDVKSSLDSDHMSRIRNLSQQKLTELANTYLDKLNQLNSEARYVIDKMPNNFLQIGLISLLFPDARIIHCRRNPLDNGLSIYFQAFIWSHDYAADLSDIGFYYGEYDRIMRHWEEVIDIPIMTVQYEDIIGDQEGISRKLLDFCGLEWDESVLQFHDLKRSVATASYDQVRQPIYKTSQARWKNYTKHIRPLIDALPTHCVTGIEDIDELINESY